MTIDPTAALSSLAPYVGAGGLVATVVGGTIAILRTLATTRLKRAEAASIEASTEAQVSTAGAQRSIVDAETIAAALAEMVTMRAAHEALAKRLDDCEEKHRASDAEIARLTATVGAQATEIKGLRREMERRGWTPPGGFPPPKESE